MTSRPETIFGESDLGTRVAVVVVVGAVAEEEDGVCIVSGIGDGDDGGGGSGDGDDVTVLGPFGCSALVFALVRASVVSLQG